MGNCGCGNCGALPGVPCGCLPATPVSTIPCCDDAFRDCGGSRLPATAAPFYDNTPVCEEDHCKQVTVREYLVSLPIASAWNVPACNNFATVSVPGLKAIEVGSYLWNSTYGYFEVTAFNKAAQQITIQNGCNDGNAAPGTLIPSNSLFVVAPPPGNSGNNPSDLYPYVAIDFTAPAVSTCIVITVTTVNGLAVGKNVQIGSGTYRVSAISSGNLITICNDGAGITPGTPVIAQNGAGNYQYPVILIDTNPCTNPVVTRGKLLVCGSTGISSPLSGVSENSVPVLIDPVNNTVEFQILAVPTRSCSGLTASLTLSTGVATYTLNVADSSVFTVGNILQIGSRTDRLTVTSIPDATHVIGTMDPVPSAFTVIPAGTSVCIIDCCEDLQNQINASHTVIGDVPLLLSTVVPPAPDANGIYVITLASALKSITTPMNIANPGALYAVKAHVTAAVIPILTFGANPFNFYQELYLKWSNGEFPTIGTCGRAAWTISDNDDLSITGYPPPGTYPNALFEKLPVGASLTMNYHAQDIEALALLGTNQSTDLQLYYKAFSGEGEPLLTFPELRVMVSGWVEIFQRN